MATHSGLPHNNPNFIPLFYSKTPSAANCVTPDYNVSPFEYFDRDSLGHEDNDRHDEYIDKIEKKIEKIVSKLLNSTAGNSTAGSSTARQETEASLIRQKDEKTGLIG